LTQSMKVHKKTRTKNEQQSASKHLPRNKWRVHNKKMRNYDASHLSQSPATAKLEHQLGNRQKFKLKRLQKAFPKTVSMTAEEQVRKKEKVSAPATVPHGHTNGGMEVENGSESEDSQEWRSYAKSVLQNGTEKGGRGGRKNSTSAAPEPVENEEVPKYHAQHDHVQNHTVLALQQGQSLCFRGRCLLTCLSGRVEVLGFTIEQGQQPYPLFSPPSHCPLTITALEDCSVSTKNKKEGRLEAKAIIRKYLSSEPRKRLLGAVDCGSCVVLLQPLDTPLTRFLTSFSELDQLFDINSKELRSQAAVRDPALSAVGVTPLHGPCSRGLVASPSYREALSSLISAWEGDFDRCPIILVCGAKNSGKSTFNRHLINSLLNHTASVEYLECDLGQTEFTPPGCLSLSTVTEPLLGPPFTHQREPDHMVFYGQTDCQVDLDRYLDSLKTLWRHYGGENPIVINTMGWVKGQALSLPALLFCPSVYHALLSSSSLCASFVLCFLQVPHSAVALGVTHCEVAPNHILYAANASLVALCCLGEKVSGRAGPVLLSQIPICQCVGFGVIRGIDMARGLYFLVTPVSPAALRQVNCLLLGEVTLPKMLLTVIVHVLSDNSINQINF
uniref:Polynucleotide 5'-hydroxyl-kinase NOL9 n=1 Tax=Astyanax mexicanus TaxID=7994 RepID=A0A8B9JH85_ASTMX